MPVCKITGPYPSFSDGHDLAVGSTICEMWRGCEVVNVPYPKPIPRSDVHFGVLKTTERTPQILTSPLDTYRVATDTGV